MNNRLTKLGLVSIFLSSYCAPLLAMAAGSPALQAIDPSQAKTDKAPASAAAPPSPNPLGRVNGTPVSGNRQPPGVPQAPYSVQPGYPYPYPPAGYQYPPGYYPPPGYAYPPGYPASYPPQGYPPVYSQPYAQYPPQGYAPPAQGAYPPQGYPGYPPAQGAYPPAQAGYPPAQSGYPPAQTGYPPAQGGYAPPQGGYAPAQPYPPAQQGYPPQTQSPPAGYPSQAGYPPANGGRPPAYSSPGSTAQRPPSGYPNENMIPDFNNKTLPAVPARPPGAPMAPPGGQGWATNVPAPAQSSSEEDRVMRLEQTAFGSTYPEHEVEDRVDHLEKEVLGGKTDAPMSDRISKLESKLGGAGAFGHTNTPIPNPNSSRNSRSSLADSDSTVGQSAPIQPETPVQPETAASEQRPPVQADSGQSSQAQVPFPAAQEEPQQLAAVAQSLTGFKDSTGHNTASSSAHSSTAKSSATSKASPTSKPTATEKPTATGKPPATAKSTASKSTVSKSTASNSTPPNSTASNPAALIDPSTTANSGIGENPGVEQSLNNLPPGSPYAQIPVSQSGAPYSGLPQSGAPQVASLPSDAQTQLSSAATPLSSPAVPAKHGKEKTKQTPQSPPRYAATRAKGAVNPPEVQAVVDTIPLDPKAGDYFSAVKKFDGDTVARWKSFPITLKLPAESPESWKKNLQVGINEWNRFIPLQAVTSAENCDIEVSWVNKLLPGVLGVTRLTTPAKGSIHVEIWLLRPTFYPPDVPEHAVQVAFMHELGHAVGIFGHSSGQDDLMASAELSLAMKGKAAPKSLTVEPKDLNTLRQIYNAPALPSGFLLSQPIEWTSSSH